MQLLDTHSHLHFDQYSENVDEVIARAHKAGVARMLTVGVNAADSIQAVQLAEQHEGIWATVGLHPHDASNENPTEAMEVLNGLVDHEKVVAIGECGFDLYRGGDARQQEAILRPQIELAMQSELPLVFHIREAFDQFFAVMADYPRWPGVVHSFSAGEAELERSLELGLHIALNGIMTFTKDPAQLAAAKRVPLERLILETDCPFLAPAPYRGKTNEPGYIPEIVHFLAELRGEDPELIATTTTVNAEQLFDLVNE